MTSLLCRHGKQDWSGDSPKCAFNEDGSFREDNWNCFLMNEIRSLCNQHQQNCVYGTHWWDEDDYVGIIYIPFGYVEEGEETHPLSGSIIILNWYKSRGRTDGFKIIQDMNIRKGTESDAKEIVQYFKKMRGFTS